MSPDKLIERGRAVLNMRYPGYGAKAARERRVLAAAWLCDDLKVREKTGNNDGEYVEAMLANTGNSKGEPWCAAAQAMAADVSSAPRPKAMAAAVIGWINWGKKLGRLVPVKEVRRGDLLARDHGEGHRHIAIAVIRVLGLVYSIEGNTSPGDEGSQENGQGMYRRVRKLSFWTHCIKGD